MQKFSQEIALVYNTDNQDLAVQLEVALNSVIDFKHFSCCRDENESIAGSLQGFQGPIILLISDNFLRTAQCMQNGLNMLNEREDSLLPVVIPGYRIDDQGEKEVISTDFSRFKQVVQYINFWQDRYLDLRKQKRNDPDLNTQGFTDFLHTIRDIAGEAGQYLRSLQAIPPSNWVEFSSNNFEFLFDFLEEEELWETFKILLDSENPTTVEETSALDVAVIDNSSSIAQEVIEEEEEGEEEVIEEEIQEEVEEVFFDNKVGFKDQEKEVTSVISTIWSLEENGEQQASLAQLKVSIKQYPDNVNLRYNLVVLLAQRAAYGDAKQEVNHLLSLTNEHPEVLFLAGELADIQGDVISAIQYFQKLADANENYPNIHYILGKLIQKQGDSPTEQIENLYKKACKKNKKNSAANYQLALLYSNGLNAPEKAEKHFKKTIKIDANHPFAHYDLAALYHKNEWYEKANKYYLKSIDLEPSLQSDQNDLAFSLIGKPQKDKNESKIQALKNEIKQLEKRLAGLE